MVETPRIERPSSYKSSHTAILYQNPTKSITLIDIPTSITVAQGTAEYLCLEQPLSSQPLLDPYPNTHPRRLKARRNLAQMQSSTDIAFPTELLEEALKWIADQWTGEWFLPRQIENTDVLEQRVSKHEGLVTSSDIVPWTATEPIILSSNGASWDNMDAVANRLVWNDSAGATSLHIASSQSNYRIPPKSCLLLSKITESSVMTFSMGALRMFPTTSTTSCAGPGTFDLVVLDPPWPNRSSKRAKHYQTMRIDDNPMSVLSRMLEQHIAIGGLVACWTTNKVAVRELALEAFADWGVELFEEWAWLKVTSQGKPITDIQNVWKKPYEVLLIGRKSGVDDRTRAESFPTAGSTQKRVIVAVPDLHSRKPNLKELIEPLLRDCERYRALEIFARNMTAGWWAWGDEVLKYNDNLAWCRRKES